LIVGDHEFFVEEAAEEARGELASESCEIERIADEELAARLPEALSTGSLFSTRRLIEADLTPLFGRVSPGKLLEEAVEAWAKDTPAGRREAFKKMRAFLAAVPCPSDSPEETARAASKKAKKPELFEPLVEILREIPDVRESRAGALAAVLAHLDRGLEGTLLLARAVDPQRSSPLFEAFKKSATIRDVSGEVKQRPGRLRARAKKLARERRIAIDDEALERLLRSTDEDPRPFASELEKLFGWAGEGGRITEKDVAAAVEDRHAEEIYAFIDTLCERRREPVLRGLSEILSGRTLRAGDHEISGEEPVRAFFGALTREIRRLCFIRARCEEIGWKMDPAVSYGAYQSRIHGKIAAPQEPFEKSLAAAGHPFGWYKSYQRACRFSLPELTRALIRCSEADAAMKDSAPPEETVAGLVAGLV
jgi:DNA polymerase III delta subunit